MSDNSSTSSVTDPLDTRDDEGWEDAASDEEKIEVKSLFSDQIFPDVQSMIVDCTKSHGFDFLDVRKKFGVFLLGFCYVLARRKTHVMCNVC
jgi:type I protein arginine methyltransferase